MAGRMTASEKAKRKADQAERALNRQRANYETRLENGSARTMKFERVICAETGQEFRNASFAAQWVSDNLTPKRRMPAYVIFEACYEGTLAYGYSWRFAIPLPEQTTVQKQAEIKEAA